MPRSASPAIPSTAMARPSAAWTCAARSPSSSTATACSTTPTPTCASSPTRSCSRRARAPASPSCSKSSARTARAWSCRGRAGSTTGSSSGPARTWSSCPPTAPEFLPDPQELDRLLARGGISSVIINNPHNPTGRVYPRELVEELVRVAVRHRCYVLYDSVYQRLDYVGWFVNPAFACPEWRDWVVSLSGLSKMDMFGASTGARACWLVISDQIRSNGVRAREILANLSAWLVATPSTLAQDWALAALQSPLAALRRPSPYMRERRDFMLRAADELALARRRAHRLRRHLLRAAGLPGPGGRTLRPAAQRRPRAGRRARLGGRVRVAALGRRGRHSRSPRSPAAATAPRATARGSACPTARRTSRNSRSSWTASRRASRSRDASAPALAAARGRPRTSLGRRVGQHLHGRSATPRSTASTRRRSPRRGSASSSSPRARIAAPDRHQAPRFHGAPRRAARTRAARGAGGCAEPRAPGPDPPRVEPARWRRGSSTRRRSRTCSGPATRCCSTSKAGRSAPTGSTFRRRSCSRCCATASCPGEDRHLLLRVPNPFLEQDEEKVAKILASVARSEHAVPPRLRTARHRAATERHLRDHGAAGELERRPRRA